MIKHMLIHMLMIMKKNMMMMNNQAMPEQSYKESQ